ncbi:MAG: iron complex outermembrane receptor protein [Paraglaciecola sp.]
MCDGTLDPKELIVNRYNHNFDNGNIEDFALFANLQHDLTDTEQLYAFGSYNARKVEKASFIEERKTVEIYYLT